jgi:lipoate-protein ligase A
VEELSIPPQMTAKQSSSKYQGFVRDRGSDAVHELEAVPPEKLKELLRDAITSVLDIGLYNDEIRKERQEQSEIIALKSKMQSCLQFLKAEVK